MSARSGARSEERPEMCTEMRTGMRPEARLEAGGAAIELLRVPAALFGFVLALRAGLYRVGLLRPKRVTVPVISVGNLTVGGTGKTPMVLQLAQELARRGLVPAVVARGYGAHVDGLNDEGAELAHRFEGLVQAQHPKRVLAAQRAIACGAQALVLDDGFQHRQLHRDLDLVLVDATRPWGLRSTRALLPRGLLREAPTALRRADLLVLTRADQVDAAALGALRAELAALAPGVAQLVCVHEPDVLVDEQGQRHALSWLAGREVCAVSGLGNPQAFERTLEQLGARLAQTVRRPDHHAWTREDLAGLDPEVPLVCTGKDAPKLRRLGVAYRALWVSARITEGAAVLEARLDTLTPTPTRKLERTRRKRLVD